MATAYGVAPFIATKLPTPDEMPQKFELDKDGKPVLNDNKEPVKNPQYTVELHAFAKRMEDLLPKMRERQELAENSCHGFNVLYEMIRKARNINFANEVRNSKA